MKIAAFFLALFACLTFTLSAPLDANTRELASIEEVNEFFNQVLKRETVDVEEFELAKRDDIPILTTLFTILNKSGLVPPVIKILATNKVTEPLLVDGIAFFLKISNLNDLLSALDSSNLAVDLVVKALSDAKFFPGLYQIVQDLRSGTSTTPAKNTLNVFQLSSAVAPILSTAAQVPGALSELSSAMSSLGVKPDAGSGLLGGILQPIAAANEAVGSAATSILPATLSAGQTAITSGIGKITGAINSGVGSAIQGAGSVTSSSSGSGSGSDSTATTTASTSLTSAPSSSSSSSTSKNGGLLGSFLGRIGSFFGFKRELPIEELVARDNELLNQLLGSLEKSGLAMSVVYQAVVDPDMHPFVEDLLKKIVKDKIITLDSLQSALEATDFLNHVIINLLKQNALNIHIS